MAPCSSTIIGGIARAWAGGAAYASVQAKIEAASAIRGIVFTSCDAPGASCAVGKTAVRQVRDTKVPVHRAALPRIRSQLTRTFGGLPRVFACSVLQKGHE